ncbi:MAG: hypothetical protein O2973_03905 [Gemmatimonadetes bacterium]|nr:hypothetical protein [Gemmatimonadota bacterium]
MGANRDTLIIGARLLEPIIRSVGAKPALFMVWPDVTRNAFFDACRDSY